MRAAGRYPTASPVAVRATLPNVGRPHIGGGTTRLENQTGVRRHVRRCVALGAVKLNGIAPTLYVEDLYYHHLMATVSNNRLVVFLLAALLVLFSALAVFRPPTRHHAYMIIEAPENLTITFLLNGRERAGGLRSHYRQLGQRNTGELPDLPYQAAAMSGRTGPDPAAPAFKRTTGYPFGSPTKRRGHLRRNERGPPRWAHARKASAFPPGIARQSRASPPTQCARHRTRTKNDRSASTLGRVLL